MDFTLKKYRELITALKDYGAISLRHDVDLKPEFFNIIFLNIIEKS